MEEEGWNVTSLDSDPQWSADIVEDILEWDYRQIPPHRFDLITASPSCTEFSGAKTAAARDLELADRLVQKVLEILHYFNPRWWWIDNPATGILKERP